MSESIRSLRELLAAAKENLRIIQERKAKYVLEIDVPLQLIRDERRLEKEIASLRAQLAQVTKLLRDESSYEIVTRELLEHIRSDYKYHSELLAFQQWLRERIELARLHGDTDLPTAEHNKITNELHKGAVSALGMTLTEVSNQITATMGPELAERSPRTTKSPLCLLEFHSRGPVWRILEDIKEAWSHFRWEEVLRLCDRALKCEKSDCRDLSARASAQLFKADALARSDNLPEAIVEAEQAKRNFKLNRDYCHEILADLLLIQIKLKAERFLPSVYDELAEMRRHCTRLESTAKESRQSREARFYRQAIETIDYATGLLADAAAKEASQSCCLNAIPVLKLSDGPDTVSQPARVISYLATDEFKIEGEGHTYYVYPLDDAGSEKLELEIGATHYALPVPEDGWPSSSSKQGQGFVLVRAQDTQEGPGIRWTGQEWLTGQFERDDTTGEIYFVEMPKAHVIGGTAIEEEKEVIEKRVIPEKYDGCVIGLLKPKGSELPSDFWSVPGC
jgi:hypothetical protein